MAKTISLYLYEDIQPNYNNTYYLTNSTQDIKTHLTSYLSTTVTADNYRVNSNVIKIKNAGTNLYSNITYAIEEIIEEGSLIYWRCYHVKSIDYQSSYTILYCEVDIWGTYFHNAKLNNIVVNQCNRAIGNGLYADIRKAESDYTQTESVISASQNTLSLVVAFKVISGGSILYLTTPNNIVLARKPLSDFTPSTSYDSLLYQVEQYVAFLAQSGRRICFSPNVPADASVVQLLYAYIVPTSLLANADFPDKTVAQVYKYLDVENNDGTWTSQALIRCIENNYIYSSSIANTKITSKLNYDLYLGVLNNTIKLPRFVKKDVNYYLNFTMDYDGVDLLIGFDNNTRNLQDNIKVSVVYTADQTSGLYNIAKGIKTLGGILQRNTVGAIKNIAEGNYFGLATQMLNLAPNEESDHTSYTSTGNVITTYGNMLTTFLNLYYVKSIEDEEANARIFGARFSEAISSIYNVFSSALLGTGSLASTYIKASCNVDEVPTDACDFIQNVLNSGAYFIDIRANDNS